MADEKNVNNAPEDDEAEYITLQFDDETEIECEILGTFEVDDAEYIALLPDDGTDDVYLYGYTEYNDGDFDLRDIEDDEEFNKVSAEFEMLALEDEE